jgi:hypothetical protein
MDDRSFCSLFQSGSDVIAQLVDRNLRFIISRLQRDVFEPKSF